MESKVNEDLILNSLLYGLDKLAETSIIASPCNTANIYLRNKSNKLVNLIDLVFLESKKYNKIGLLATQTTIESGIYSYDNVIITKRKELVTQSIVDVLKGNKKRAKLKINQIIREYEQKGCDAILLGCTELPLIISKKDTKMKVIDTLNLLVCATAKNYLKSTKLK